MLSNHKPSLHTVMLPCHRSASTNVNAKISYYLRCMRVRVHHSTARQGRAPATRAENEETLHRQRVTRRGGVTDCARMTHIAGLHASRFALTIFSLPAVAARSWFRDRSSMSCRFRSACSESDRAISGARRRPAAAHLHDGSATNQPTNGRAGGWCQTSGG